MRKTHEEVLLFLEEYSLFLFIDCFIKSLFHKEMAKNRHESDVENGLICLEGEVSKENVGVYICQMLPHDLLKEEVDKIKLSENIDREMQKASCCDINHKRKGWSNKPSSLGAFSIVIGGRNSKANIEYINKSIKDFWMDLDEQDTKSYTNGTGEHTKDVVEEFAVSNEDIKAKEESDDWFHGEQAFGASVNDFLFALVFDVVGVWHGGLVKELEVFLGKLEKDLKWVESHWGELEAKWRNKCAPKRQINNALDEIGKN